MPITDVGEHRAENRGKSPKVLVCTCGAKIHSSFESDKLIYSRFCRDVSSAQFTDVPKFLEGIDNGFDVVHVLGEFPGGGKLIDHRNRVLLGSELIAKCHSSGVKLLWIAAENRAEDYIQGFKTFGRQINLVMTISRNGTGFSSFLERLLSKLAAGSTLTSAWVSLAPQAGGVRHQELPACIFSAGRPDYMFFRDTGNAR